MSQAESVSITSRRAMLAGSPPPGADVEALRLAAEIVLNDVEIDRLIDRRDAVHGAQELDRIDAMIRELVMTDGQMRARLAQTPVITTEGRKAKARVLLMYSDCGQHDPCSDGAMAYSLAHDVLGTPPMWKRVTPQIARGVVS